MDDIQCDECGNYFFVDEEDWDELCPHCGADLSHFDPETDL